MIEPETVERPEHTCKISQSPMEVVSVERGSVRRAEGDVKVFECSTDGLYSFVVMAQTGSDGVNHAERLCD